MKFAHLADCHIGGWREQRMRDLSSKAFSLAIDECIKRDVDFILISGDLFNTSVPAIDDLKLAVIKLRELKDAGIQAYTIAGSHDFSPMGKTILDVLEEAELCINVVKADKAKTKELGKLVLRFTEDKKTGAKIAGMLGRRGMLERTYYEGLHRENLESEQGFKIFMFHTAITELKTEGLEKMDSSPISMLPRGFDYYAGGHVHIVKSIELPGYSNVVYPGPVFPNSFSELEKLGHGGFYLFDSGKAEYLPIAVANVVTISLDAENKTSQQVSEELIESMKGTEFRDAVVLVRAQGLLSSGKPGDIDFPRAFSKMHEAGAYFVMRNTAQLRSVEFQEIKAMDGSVDEIESSLIDEHLGKIKVSGWDAEKEKDMTKRLFHALSSEKKEGEKSYDFESRVTGEVKGILRQKDEAKKG